MTDDRLEEIKKRCEAATPGPWHVHQYHDETENEICINPPGTTHNSLDELVIGAIGQGDSSPYCLDSNADFIAHSREDIPWLIEQIELYKRAAKYMRLAVSFDETEEEALTSALSLATQEMEKENA